MLNIIKNLRNDITKVPNDPFIVFPTSKKCSEEIFKGDLLSQDDACDILLKPMQGIDLTRLWASEIFLRVLQTLGQHHWFETETFRLIIH